MIFYIISFIVIKPKPMIMSSMFTSIKKIRNPVVIWVPLKIVLFEVSVICPLGIDLPSLNAYCVYSDKWGY